MDFSATPLGLLTATGLGLLVGLVREHLHGKGRQAAGVRTYTLVALGAGVAAGFGLATLLGFLLLTGALTLAAYLRLSGDDPGLTGEFALLVTALLAALAQTRAPLAAGLGVAVAALLFAKQPMRRFARDVLSAQEIRDALLLGASALVVLPLLPNSPVDPWGALVPARIWRLVVLMLGVGMLGHVALRLLGARWGLPAAGFFAGLASSTAAVASFGQRARANPTQLQPCIAAGLVANLASLLLLGAVVLAVTPASLRLLAPVLAGGAVGLLAASARGFAATGKLTGALPPEPEPRAFRLGHALLLGAVMALVLVASAWVRETVGVVGALAATALLALAELHAAAATLAQLGLEGALQPAAQRWGLVGLLGASGAVKSGLAYASGGRGYGTGLLVGLAAECLGASAGALLAA